MCSEFFSLICTWIISGDFDLSTPKYSFIRRFCSYLGTLEIPKFEFDTMLKQFSARTMLTKSEAISAICKSQYECLEARSKLMFHIPVAKHMRLEEFEQSQSMVTSQVATFLKVSLKCSRPFAA